VRTRHAAVAVATLALLAACSDRPAGPTVPRLAGSPSPSASAATGPARQDALRRAAECIRQHGMPNYQDPVLTADGHVYTDTRAFHDADGPTVTAVEAACRTLIQAANFKPDDEAPAPPALVAAGAKSAQCLRAHGMPNVKDPNSQTEFTPGHGFGLTPQEVPAGGKSNPVVRAALEACRPVLDDEARISSLGNLADGQGK
jgi:hypothetical protein